jgi:hypothetical protein
LKKLFLTIKFSLEKNLEEFEHLLAYKDTLERLINDGEAIFDAEDVSKFVFEELIPGVSKRLLAVKTTTEQFSSLIVDILTLTT